MSKLLLSVKTLVIGLHLNVISQGLHFLKRSQPKAPEVRISLSLRGQVGHTMSLESTDSEAELWETEPRVCRWRERKAEGNAPPPAVAPSALGMRGPYTGSAPTQLQRH